MSNGTSKNQHAVALAAQQKLKVQPATYLPVSRILIMTPDLLSMSQ
jgi:hypothetical protein